MDNIAVEFSLLYLIEISITILEIIISNKHFHFFFKFCSNSIYKN